MKLHRKLPVSVNFEDGQFTIKGEGFFARTKDDPQLEGILELSASYSGKVNSEELPNLGVLAVLEKMDKYQTGKMSGKEAQKMANKLKEIPEAAPLIEKFVSNQKLESSDIEQLTSWKITKNLKIDYNFLSLDETNLLVDDADLQLIFPEGEFQEELKEQFSEEQAAYRREQSAKIAAILGTEKKTKQKSVVEYLREKQEAIAQNKEISHSLDMLSPFPQANDLERVLQLGSDVASSSKESIDLEMLENDLNKRDVAYYSSALSFLGLVFVDARSLCLTRAGEHFFQQPKDVQKVILRETLCQDELIAKILSDEEMDEEELKKEFAVRGLGEETMKRRLSCLKSWKKYLDS